MIAGHVARWLHPRRGCTHTVCSCTCCCSAARSDALVAHSHSQIPRQSAWRDSRQATSHHCVHARRALALAARAVSTPFTERRTAISQHEQFSRIDVVWLGTAERQHVGRSAAAPGARESARRSQLPALRARQPRYPALDGRRGRQCAVAEAGAGTAEAEMEDLDVRRFQAGMPALCDTG